MSRIKTIKCDKCKKIMDESDEYGSYSGTLKAYCGNSSKIDIDLCWSCTQKLLKWLTVKK